MAIVAAVMVMVTMVVMMVTNDEDDDDDDDDGDGDGHSRTLKGIRFSVAVSVCVLLGDHFIFLSDLAPLLVPIRNPPQHPRKLMEGSMARAGTRAPFV